ncbi:MAG TPA: NADH-binding protein, partial [Microlunatus sp.]|nr:NADH-binding protein [Microlunatus sp.]
TQPIALPDVIRYLVGVLKPVAARGRVFEIGGPDVLTYAEMLQRVARNHHRRPLPILIVPLLTPRLSSHWLALVTDVDTATARNLVDSMSTEVIVHDQSIREIVPGEPLDYDEAVRRALAAQESRG